MLVYAVRGGCVPPAVHEFGTVVTPAGAGSVRSIAVPVAVYRHTSPGLKIVSPFPLLSEVNVGVTPVVLSVTDTWARGTDRLPVLVTTYVHVTMPPGTMFGTPAAFGSLASKPFVYSLIEIPGVPAGANVMCSHEFGPSTVTSWTVKPPPFQEATYRRAGSSCARSTLPTRPALAQSDAGVVESCRARDDPRRRNRYSVESPTCLRWARRGQRGQTSS